MEKENSVEIPAMLNHDINKLFEITAEQGKQQATLEANVLALTSNVNSLIEDVREGTDITNQSIQRLADNMSLTSRPNYQLIGILLTAAGMLSTFGGAFLTTVGYMALGSVQEAIKRNESAISQNADREYFDNQRISTLANTVSSLESELVAHREVMFRQADWHQKHDKEVSAIYASQGVRLDYLEAEALTLREGLKP